MEPLTPHSKESPSVPFRFSLRELLVALGLLSAVFVLTPFWHQLALNVNDPHDHEPGELPTYLTSGADVYKAHTPRLAIFFSIAVGGVAYAISRRGKKYSLGDGLRLATPLLLLPYPLAPMIILFSIAATLLTTVVTLGVGLMQQRLWCAICCFYNLLWLIEQWSWFNDLFIAFRD